MATQLLHPAHFQIARFDGKDWFFLKSEQFLNPSRIPVPNSFGWKDKLSYFGSSMSKLVLEFRLIGSRQPGYYLADLKEHRYYYCGRGLEDVRLVLVSLGIGRLEAS